MATNTQAQNQTADAGFPTPEPVAAPPKGSNKPNPAVPVVKAALGKGWQKFTSANEKDAKDQRALVARAKDILGVNARTRTHKDETGKAHPTIWYMLVTEREAQETSSDS